MRPTKSSISQQRDFVASCSLRVRHFAIVIEVFANFGLNLSEAINTFLHMSIKRQGFPFEIREPRLNADTLLAMLPIIPQILDITVHGRRSIPSAVGGKSPHFFILAIHSQYN